MKKLVVGVLLGLALAGCSSGTCKDGRGGMYGLGGSYKACDFCCVGDEAQKKGVERKDCRCSTACPCWKRHE